MANEMTISFKVFLISENSNEKPEVRRFGIDRDAVSSFIYLHHKLQQVFPALQGRSFSVAWKDVDGDEITISSDEDLIIALTEMQTEVRKIYVKLLPKSRPSVDNNQQNNTVHVGVVCDGCQNQVTGFRYKCVQCPDYDLCQTCESQACHPEHNMIRIPVPRQFRPHFGRRLNRILNRASQLAEECPVRADPDSGCEESTCRRYKKHHASGHYMHAKKMRYCNVSSDPECEVLETSGEDSDAYKKHHKHRHHQKHSREHRPNIVRDLLGSVLGWNDVNLESETRTANEPCPEWPAKIAREVAKLLNPLGDLDIEVKVKPAESENAKKDEGNKSADVEMTENKDTATTSNSDNATAPQNATKVRFSVPEETNTASRNTQEPFNLAGNLQQLTEFLSQQRISDPTDKDEWTILNPEFNKNSPQQPENNGINNANISVNKQPVAQQETVVELGINPQPISSNISVNNLENQRPIYPNLSQTAATLNPAPQYPRHANPIVADSIDKMISMGFSNDGGWLTQLMEAKNGDIYKALDVLQPHK